MRKQIITPEMIIEATINCVAEYSLENVTTKKVAASISISEGTIFNNFPNKRTLLIHCFHYIDRKIDSVLQNISFEDLDMRKNISMLWHQYFNYLVKHRAYTKFYKQFRQSSYYTPEVIEGQNTSFQFFANFLMQNKDLVTKLSDGHPGLYWTYLIETTLNFAIRTADGRFEHTPENTERIFNLIGHGFFGNLKI